MKFRSRGSGPEARAKAEAARRTRASRKTRVFMVPPGDVKRLAPAPERCGKIFSLENPWFESSPPRQLSGTAQSPKGGAALEEVPSPPRDSRLCSHRHRSDSGEQVEDLLRHGRDDRGLLLPALLHVLVQKVR